MALELVLVSKLGYLSLPARDLKALHAEAAFSLSSALAPGITLHLHISASKEVCNAYAPTETLELISRAGVRKGNMRVDKVFFSSVSAGCLLSFACATFLNTNSSP